METASHPVRSVTPIRVADLRPRDKGLPWLLLRRAEAERVGEELVERLREAEPGTVLVVDLAEVETRASCLALLLGAPLRLVQAEEGEPELADRFVVLDGLCDNAHDADLALSHESLIAITREEGRTRLIGKIDRKVAETYEYARRNTEVTSAMFTEPPFELKISAANARVAKLHRLGLLRFLREEVMDVGGRRFVYQAVV
jgi:hypothetical protein